jgi:hypothetical protein
MYIHARSHARSATASALLDCDAGEDGEECMSEEVATIVVTDIQEQRRKQVCEGSRVVRCF